MEAGGTLTQPDSPYTQRGPRERAQRKAAGQGAPPPAPLPAAGAGTCASVPLAVPLAVACDAARLTDASPFLPTAAPSTRSQMPVPHGNPQSTAWSAGAPHGVRHSLSSAHRAAACLKHSRAAVRAAGQPLRRRVLTGKSKHGSLTSA